MKKQNILNIIHKLPEEFDLEELIEQLIFVEKVEIGLEQVKKGMTIKHEEVKRIIKNKPHVERRK